MLQLNGGTFIIFFILRLSNIKADILMTDVINNDIEETDSTFTPDDFMAAETSTDADLSHLGIEIMRDPLSQNKLEGDMAVNDIHQFIRDSNQLGRNAIRSRWRRWPNGEIPYVLSSRYGKYSRKTIARAMAAYHKKTCIKFVPRDSKKHRDYIYIFPDDGCYSLVGRTGGRQPLSLDAGCILTGTVIHELMHTVGFFHEQSRSDRDNWIEIDWKNVLSGARDQFDKYSLRTITHLDEEYDYDSIMHYGAYAFSRNGRKTILPKKSGGRRMGQRDGFSRTDLAKINKLYHCDMGKKDKDKDKEKGKQSKGSKPQQPNTTPSPKTSAGKCEDNNWRCFFWSLGVIDYCSKYEKVRKEICPKSCGTCSSDSTSNGETKETKQLTTVQPTPSTTTASTTTTATESSAVRKSKKYGCQDKNPNCPKWAHSGLCSKDGYKKFMSKYCGKSCQTCNGGSEAGKKSKRLNETAEEETKCKDAPGYKMQCHFIKQLGGCKSRRNRRITETYCRKSCRLC